MPVLVRAVGGAGLGPGRRGGATQEQQQEGAGAAGGGGQWGGGHWGVEVWRPTGKKKYSSTALLTSLSKREDKDPLLWEENNNYPGRLPYRARVTPVKQKEFRSGTRCGRSYLYLSFPLSAS